jgi:hypothetical protein
MHTLCGCMQVLPLAGCDLVGGWARGLPPLLPPPLQGKLTLCPICRVSGTTPGLAVWRRSWCHSFSFCDGVISLVAVYTRLEKRGKVSVHEGVNSNYNPMSVSCFWAAS